MQNLQLHTFLLKLFTVLSEQITMNYELQKLKMEYIPQCAAGLLSNFAGRFRVLTG